MNDLCQWGVNSRKGACNQPSVGVVNTKGVSEFPSCKHHAEYAQSFGWNFIPKESEPKP